MDSVSNLALSLARSLSLFVPRVVLPDRALCLPTFYHLLEAVLKTRLLLLSL